MASLVGASQKLTSHGVAAFTYWQWGGRPHPNGQQRPPGHDQHQRLSQQSAQP